MVVHKDSPRRQVLESAYSAHVNITPTALLPVDQDQGSSGRWQLLALPGPSANAPPCLPWVGFQDVGDTKLHLRDLQGFTCRE